MKNKIYYVEVLLANGTKQYYSQYELHPSYQDADYYNSDETDWADIYKEAVGFCDDRKISFDKIERY